jgi:hypothetical protein
LILELDVIKKDSMDKDGKEDSKEQDVETDQYKPCFPILQKFEEKRGVYDLINVALAVVKTFKSKKSKEIWTIWLEEIKYFSELPQFFNYFS